MSGQPHHVAILENSKIAPNKQKKPSFVHYNSLHPLHKIFHKNRQQASIKQFNVKYEKFPFSQHKQISMKLFTHL